ncbi:acyl-CoA dehydrogenase family protein, partial [Klebsiella pneumoniae]|nr:acyl-CoA dehydrogenase family protein [Klebsiella pneumoniae]
VYASESGGRTPVLRPDTDGDPSRWVLDGEKPWCSLADRCAHAVVTGREADGTRRAVLVDLRHRGVEESDGAWPALGLA